MRLPLALSLVALLVAQGAAATAPAGTPPRLLDLRVTNGSTPYLGDARLLATVSPNGDGFRDAAHALFTLTAPATVELDVLQTDTLRQEGASTHLVQRVRRSLPKGPSELIWRPARATPPRTYVLALTVSGPGGRRVYGPGLPGTRVRAPVVTGWPLAFRSAKRS